MREVSADGDRALGRRLAKAAGAVAAGLLVAASFPPLGWWLSAIVGLALLAWVLADPLTSVAGGFGDGLLFGLAFYLPLLPWVAPWWARFRGWRWPSCVRFFPPYSPSRLCCCAH
ncbi:hypothetical protein QQA43_32630 (plasmid) [Mycolicibacterium vanbaalenii]|uniref:hypothetical protein n=1 Tax=Mycolicibacterium vanbaalenii TaxID=110539 RepID=UPI0028778441|nr:hypothetical protein [Mycolicibacterium vanbaalenii]WND60317.1 hypothetical protein QQA43_32630 [Mycolicibacterium vanbaalenii]